MWLESMETPQLASLGRLARTRSFRLFMQGCIVPLVVALMCTISVGPTSAAVIFQIILRPAAYELT